MLVLSRVGWGWDQVAYLSQIWSPVSWALVPAVLLARLAFLSFCIQVNPMCLYSFIRQSVLLVSFEVHVRGHLGPFCFFSPALQQCKQFLTWILIIFIWCPCFVF